MFAAYLTLNEFRQRERNASIQREMAKLPFPVQRVNGTRVFSTESGCSKSCMLLVREAYKRKEPLVMFEDDAVIGDVDAVTKCIYDAIDDPIVDCCYVGTHLFVNWNGYVPTILDETDKWYRIKNVLGTHAIVIKRPVQQMLMNYLEVVGTYKGQPNIDVVIEMKAHTKFYCVVPKRIEVGILKTISSRTNNPSGNTIEEINESFQKVKDKFYATKIR